MSRNDISVMCSDLDSDTPYLVLEQGPRLLDDARGSLDEDAHPAELREVLVDLCTELVVWEIGRQATVMSVWSSMGMDGWWRTHFPTKTTASAGCTSCAMANSS